MALPSETRFTVAVSDAERLDRFLAEQLQVSRTVAARLIGEGCVRIGGEAARASFVPPRGCDIEVIVPGEAPRQLLPQDIPITIVYEDEHLAVVDKPAGMVVHPAPGNWDGTLVNALAAKGLNLAGGAEGRPGIVHRLDKDTSGLLVVAKTPKAHEKLAKAITTRKMRRRYAALAWGHLGDAERVIDAPLARHAQDRKRMAIAGDGKAALTRVVTVARGNVADLVRCTLETGRTHQIRVHLQSIGHSVVGDGVYGGGNEHRADASWKDARALVEATPRQALHAAWLTLPHPATGKPLDVRSEWPVDLRPALAQAVGLPELLAETKPLQYLGFFASGDPA